ncbi:MAG: Hpt domain-containing protein [Hyphomicrobiaceae bacterium]|nr:Hpt domain-containing protein [Hyphomicrobiaceae bacterium]
MSQAIDLAHLGRYTMSDRALEAEILNLFVGQVPETIGRLRSANTEAEWRAAAHTLKGSARAVGAWRLADRAADAEKSASEQDVWPSHISLIEAAASEASAFVEDLTVPSA